ncbi:hypothetical protein KSP40_PGU005102 [Platanthera guangdongensis]|uniref:Uncharacterized protein n=1 Tax=Platanthera guangdongensis TaxID=2320717 RepID=A0ABR2MXM4_9ASPA
MPEVPVILIDKKFKMIQNDSGCLAAIEATGPANVGEEHLQASVLEQDWFSPTTRSFTSALKY